MIKLCILVGVCLSGAFAGLVEEVETGEYVCMLPKKVGSCRAAFPRFFYNHTSRNCEEFIYGGCEANGNNFEAVDLCNSKCVNPCELPRDPGTCRAALPKFFYNKETNKCEPFTYGGCGGNTNNFNAKVDCVERCVNPCSLPKEIGPCKAALSRYFFDRISGKCESFLFGGCNGNANNFHTQEECSSNCVNPCMLPTVVGSCDAALPKYYYNKETKKCELFSYGGCGRNANNFDTEAECDEQCGDPCMLPKVIGNCRAAFSRFFYNKDTMMCESFIYGGCGDNGNNFNTEGDCKATCGHHVQNPCGMPKVAGPCEAYMPRFYYNSDNKSCEQFIYGGCQGNANNFGTVKECDDRCVEKRPEESPCGLPPVTGPCKAMFKKFYYNSTNQTCESFVYGGCQGNANNFESMDECQDMCSGVSRCVMVSWLLVVFATVIKVVAG